MFVLVALSDDVLWESLIFIEQGSTPLALASLKVLFASTWPLKASLVCLIMIFVILELVTHCYGTNAILVKT